MHHFNAWQPKMAALLANGEVTYLDDIWEGIENVVPAFLGMLKGDNIGKRLVRLADE